MKIAYTSDLHYGINHSYRKTLIRFLEKIAKEEADIFIIAGDIISDSQNQYEKFFKLATERIKSKILIVCGNHDYWDMNAIQKSRYKPMSLMSIRDVIEYHDQIHEKYNIYYLEDDPVRISEADCIIYGFDGWYKHLEPPSNDASWIPGGGKSEIEIHKEMNTRAHISIQNILYNIKLNKGYTHKICVTHFSPYLMYEGDYETMCGNPRYLDFLTEDFDYLICGHNHKKADFIHSHGNNSIRVLNSGSDYSKPKYNILEL